MSRPDSPIDETLVLQLRSRNVEKNETNPHLRSHIVEGWPQLKSENIEKPHFYSSSPSSQPSDDDDKLLASFNQPLHNLTDEAETLTGSDTQDDDMARIFRQILPSSRLCG